MKHFSKISLILATLFFLSCSDSETKESQLEYTINEDEIVENYEFEESDDQAFIPPSPMEVANVFKTAGLNYNLNDLNPVENAHKYQTKFKKAINFGSYSTDLACCVVNNKISDAQKYLETIKLLGDEIGLVSVFKEEMITKFKNNLNNIDSLVDVLTEVQISTSEYIEINGEDDLQSIYFAGAWLEGMYLGSLTVLEQDGGNVVEKLNSQIELGSKIARGLEAIDTPDPEIEEMRYNIMKVVNSYNNFESIRNLTAEDLDMRNIHLTQAEKEEISGLIIELRSQMINQ